MRPYDYRPDDPDQLSRWVRRLGHAIPRPGSRTLAEDLAMTRPDLRTELADLAESLYDTAPARFLSSAGPEVGEDERTT